jgi:uncharacterized membrane protein YeaQ/YmgE (transglycosylase-associated protein family)
MARLPAVHRGVLSICILVGATIGGLLPTLAGAGSFSLASLFGSVVGAIVGVFVAARLTA